MNSNRTSQADYPSTKHKRTHNNDENMGLASLIKKMPESEGSLQTCNNWKFVKARQYLIRYSSRWPKRLKSQYIWTASVTRILLGGGVSVSDTYRIKIRPGYATDTFLAVSWKNGYVFAWIRVSDTIGPDGIQPKAVISPPKCCFDSKRWYKMMNLLQ